VNLCFHKVELHSILGLIWKTYMVYRGVHGLRSDVDQPWTMTPLLYLAMRLVPGLYFLNLKVLLCKTLQSMNHCHLFCQYSTKLDNTEPQSSN